MTTVKSNTAMTEATLEFRNFKYANTEEPGGAKLFCGDAWIGTVWRYVCGWSWCMVSHPTKIAGACDGLESGCRKLVEEFHKFNASEQT
jgi:hypothetical protein